MNCNLFRMALILLAILTFSFTTSAQSNRGDIIITAVSEETETPVSGATVKVWNRAKTKTLAETQTDAQGKARIKDVLVGDVFVEVISPDIGEDGAIMTITGGADNNFEAYLAPKDEADVVVIKADRLLVNTSDPNSGATTRRNASFIKKQVTDGQTLQGVLSTVPGVQSNSLGQVHVRGEHKAMSLTLDGVALPITTESSTTQPLDPEFLESAEVSTGMYDAAQGGQQGLIIDATTPGEGEKPFVEFETRAGDRGQAGVILKAGGSTDDNSLSYFVGAKVTTSDLYTEAPNPNQQELNNNGSLNSFMLRLNKKTDGNRFGLTFSHQGANFGVPQTPQNFEAGVSQEQKEKNTLALLSWKHELTEKDDILMGLAFQRNTQRISNNGVFTPFTAVPGTLEEELAEEGFPLDPENPGSPYLPSTSLTITQFKPSLDWTHRIGERNRVKAGLTANFIHSDQELSITDPGGGGGLPNPNGQPGTPTAVAANLERRAFNGGVYVSHTAPLSEKVTINYGLRADTFDNGLGISTGQISPRLNLVYAPTEEQAFRVSYNKLFQPPPLELDVSGGTEVQPQRTDAYEISYENQFAKNVVGKIAYVVKDYKDQIDVGLLIPNSNIPIFAPINFARAEYKGLELSVLSSNKTGWNGFVTATIGEARPTQPGIFAGHFPEFNDHDQQVQATAGVSHTWENGISAGLDVLYGSGFPQEALPLYNSVGITPFGLTGERQDRFITNLNLQYRPEDKDGGTIGAGLQVFNLFDDRSLLNLFSEFSGTRFVSGRRFLFNLNARF